MRQATKMRTTLSIADDVMTAAKAIARRERSGIGNAISDLARPFLRPGPAGGTRNGVPSLPISNEGAVVTADIVNGLRDKMA